MTARVSLWTGRQRMAVVESVRSVYALVEPIETWADTVIGTVSVTVAPYECAPIAGLGNTRVLSSGS